jgi:hypothetical protein
MTRILVAAFLALVTSILVILGIAHLARRRDDDEAQEDDQTRVDDARVETGPAPEGLPVAKAVGRDGISVVFQTACGRQFRMAADFVRSQAQSDEWEAMHTEKSMDDRVLWTWHGYIDVQSARQMAWAG